MIQKVEYANRIIHWNHFGIELHWSYDMRPNEFVLYGYDNVGNDVAYKIASSENEEELRIWAELNDYDISNVEIQAVVVF